MKILYAIQGTGNGHMSRAMEIVPLLKKRAHTDVLISGIQTELSLPFDVNYRLYGMGFVFGKKGGVDLIETYKKSRLINFKKEIRDLPVEKYDLVISDFEPVSCRAAKRLGIPVIGLSNQAAVLASGAPQAKNIDPVGRYILKNYAPVDFSFGFHFQRYNKDIYTPIIRKQIRTAEISNNGHFTVYLPAFDDERILRRLTALKNAEWHVFSKHTKKTYQFNNVKVYPIQNELFMESFLSCSGIITGCGFGTPGEALFLGKKLIVVPMKNQFEQQCNAIALKNMGVSVIGSLKKKHLPAIENWMGEENKIAVNYPDETEKIIDEIIKARQSRFLRPIQNQRNIAS